MRLALVRDTRTRLNGSFSFTSVLPSHYSTHLLLLANLSFSRREQEEAELRRRRAQSQRDKARNHQEAAGWITRSVQQSLTVADHSLSPTRGATPEGLPTMEFCSDKIIRQIARYGLLEFT